MKKLTVLSIVVASLLLVGCGDSATGAEAKAAATPAVEATEAPATETAPAKEVAAATPAATEAEAKKCGEGKCGGDKKSAATEAQEAAAVVVEKTTEAVTEKVAEAKDSVVATAAAATAAVTATATAAVETTKEAASAVAEKATEAVAAATGPDGKALYAKCAGCHGADGKTAALGKSAVIAGQAKGDIVTKIAGYKAGTLNVSGMGALMQGQVASYSDAEIEAVAGYISGL